MKKYLFLLFIFIIFSCKFNKPIINIGVNSWPPCEVWYIAEKMGYFKDVNVNIVRYQTWTDNIKSLYQGQTDISHSTYFNALYYSDKGRAAKIILSSDTIIDSDGLVIKHKYNNPVNLNGKKIAVELNTDEHFLLKKALEKYKLTENDIIIIPCTSKEAMDKFIHNEVDACFTYEPYLSQAAAEGNGKIVFTTKDIPGYMIDTLMASNDIIKERKKDIRSIIKAWYKALDYIKNHPDLSYPLMAEKEDMSSEEFKPFFESFIFYNAEKNKNIFHSDIFKKKIEEINDFLFLHKSINKKVDIPDIFTDELIN